MNLEQAIDVLSGMVPPVSHPGQILLERDGRVAHLRIDNPTARGAVTVAMMRDLASAVHELAAFDGSLIVLSSTDPHAFCSGGHLAEVSKVIASRELAMRMSRAMTAVLDGLLALPVPSVAALDGLAIGGGAELAVACDWRIASPEARIHFVHAHLGIAPGWGGTARLARLVGRNHALRVLTRARPVSRGEAMAFGLIDSACDGRAVDEALRWCDALLQHPPEAVRAIKAQVAAVAPPRTTVVEAERFADVWGGPAHQEALDRLGRHRR